MTAAHAVWAGVIVFFMMLFSPTRALLGAILKQGITLGAIAGKFLLNTAQAVLANVWRAHLTLLVNLMPRAAALPSVGKKTTRRE